MITIRFATAKDSNSLRAIYKYYVEYTAITFEYNVPTKEDFFERVEKISGIYPYVVAEIDEKIVGYAYATRFRERKAYDWAVETSVYVDKKQQGKGVGKALYKTLLNLLEKQGFVMAYACVTSPNPASDAIHASLGFSKIGIFTNSGYKLETWHDTVWYEKQLISKHNGIYDIKRIEEIKKTFSAEVL